MFNKEDSKSTFEMRQAIYGDECVHPHIATSLNNLGGVYLDQVKHEEALEMYERSISINQAVYGEKSTHPNIAASLNNLERAYHVRGKFEGRV